MPDDAGVDVLKETASRADCAFYTRSIAYLEVQDT